MNSLFSLLSDFEHPVPLYLNKHLHFLHSRHFQSILISLLNCYLPLSFYKAFRRLLSWTR
ncbi:hypothetical protein I7I53_12223 [Histoplasma capsulatum var. duboisii H88]|uniref:Uncharacterized protein n=1 Tax=Ajellomyces capsulatus (strain H88) TaxID=544711 RepID=A0A8A1LZR0_AJEC8|nr:hypothetical protein I7I53_12223 [Histoplasma capsulatum var. duboisii H88]